MFLSVVRSFREDLGFPAAAILLGQQCRDRAEPSQGRRGYWKQPEQFVPERVAQFTAFVRSTTSTSVAAGTAAEWSTASAVAGLRIRIES